jgi:hypothetical protein
MTKQCLKQRLLAMATILTVIGGVAPIDSLIPVTSSDVPQEATISARPTTMSQQATLEIVPAPRIDPKAEVFIGTGDQSAGSWVRP